MTSRLQFLATCKDVTKASRRDLGIAIAQGRTASTTVAATMMLANLAGIRLFATGGIGGAHRGHGNHSWDISADLSELARTPVAVVCAGAKSILDIPRTLEILETQGVPVVGYGTDEFPAFYVHSSGEHLSARVDDPDQAAEVLHAHWSLDGAGIVLRSPSTNISPSSRTISWPRCSTAERQAMGNGVRGKELTPFLLGKLADLTEGQTLKANHALVLANARLAAQIRGRTPNCKPLVIMPESTPPIAETAPRLPRSSWPWWVRVFLSGLQTRSAARFCLWFAVVLALGCALVGLRL